MTREQRKLLDTIEYYDHLIDRPSKKRGPFNRNHLTMFKRRRKELWRWFEEAGQRRY